MYAGGASEVVTGRLLRRLSSREEAVVDVPPAQIALAWLLHKPGVSAPIVGTTNWPTSTKRSLRTLARAACGGAATSEFPECARGGGSRRRSAVAEVVAVGDSLWREPEHFDRRLVVAAKT
jgi:hypothetical protein